jgi:hypothetical protein
VPSSRSLLSLRKFLFPLALVLGAGVSILQAQTSNASAVPEVAAANDVAVHTSADKLTGAPESSSAMSDHSPADRVRDPSSARGSTIGSSSAPDSQQSPRYGGIHEFSIDAGISRSSGPIWGYRQDVDYEAVHLRYSREMKNARNFTAYYSPEVTPYARLDEPVFNDNDTGTVEIGRKHTTGGGVSPVGFTIDFLPRHRVQPFWACDAGMLYFRDRVLSPQGSQFMYTIDFGAGLHVYQNRFVSTTIGFRYDHLSNANISLHNPGTDAELWYIGFSRFHSPKSRQNE